MVVLKRMKTREVNSSSRQLHSESWNHLNWNLNSSLSSSLSRILHYRL